MEFYDAWWYLTEHKMFKSKDKMCGSFQESLDVFVAKVNPENNTIDDDNTKNTKVEIWLECGPYYEEDGLPMACHDINLDCAAKTYDN